MSEESAVSAIERGDLSELQHVLEESEWDIGSEPLDSKGQTALHIACANGHLDIVQYLVNKKGCIVTVEDVYGHTPLMLSFINKHWKVANSLLQITPNSALNELEGTLTRYNKSIVMQVAEETLDTSCKEGYFELVKYLIESGWHRPTVDHKEIIKLARCFDNLHIVKYLLTRCQCTMPDDMSEVHIACIQGVVEKLKMALDSNGSSLLGTADDFGTTPIHYATLEPNLLRMIVQYAGAKLLNITDSMGNTPLHHSIKYECIESVIILVEAPGCDVNLANLKGEAPLIAACKYSNSDIVQVLVANERSNINTSDSKGQTALHIACANGQMDIVQYLVNKKECSVTVEDVYGHSPPMLSFINEHWKVVNYLLQIAPDSVISELEGTRILTSYNISIVAKEALTASCKEGYFELVKYLIKSEWHTVDDKEIKLARCFDNLHIVKYLLTHCQCTMPDDMSDVHIACIQGVVEKVKKALDSNGSSLLGTADDYGTTPVHYATLEPNLLRMMVQYAGEMLLNITDSRGNTPLHHSIKYECIESVTILVEAPGCDVNIANLKGETPLIAACKYSNSDIVQLLVASERCDLNICDGEENAPLHVTVSKKSIEQLKNVQCLLQSDRCDPNVINKSGLTPLHIVCHRSEIPLLKILATDKRCDLNIQDGNGDTALHIGVENVEVVKCLLESGRSRCDIYNEKGLTPFHKAIANGVMASVEVMMTNGVNILQTSNDRFQNAPIHIACIYSRLEILKVLLGHKNCDSNQQNSKGDTALNVVCRMRTGRELQFLEVLTSIPGINPTLVNHEGNAPIHLTCMNSRLESLKALLSCGSCNPNQQNSKGDTALHIVCRMRTGRELQFLEVLTSTPGINPTLLNLDGDAAFDVIGIDGNTLLHIACAEGNTALIELLVKNRANVLTLNLDGDAPIHTACMNSRPQSLKVLLSCESCDPNQQNSSGDTALHIVCRERTGRELQLLEVLTSTPGINSTLLNLVGNAPIHIACIYFRLQSLKVFLSCESCDPNHQNSRGDTALHIMCRIKTGDELQFLEVLTSTPGINPTLVNHEGNAPIHTACMNSRPQSLKVLLSCESCDPNQQNSKGDTALHIVCRVRAGRELQLLDVLTSTPGINPALVNHEGIAPCDVVDSDGNTLLHIACTEGNTAIVDLLARNRANVLTLNHRGNAPIHTACMNSRLESLKVLLKCESCDPNQQNSKGDTALHIVCRMRTGNELQFFKMLTSTPGINPTLENHEGIAPFDVVGDDGNTLLHNACVVGNTTLIELLVKNGANVLKTDRHGDAPIHIACKYSNLKTLKILVSSSCGPNQQNADGDTALHIVCRAKLNDQDKQQYIQELISTPGIKPDIINHAGFTPVELRETSYSVIKMINSFLEHEKSSIQAYLKIFVVGNSGTGKSTLIKAVTTEASQLRKYTPLSKMKYVNPSDVPLHTAGIVPIPFNSKHFGNAVLYDFAGQHEYYSSHAAVMENLILPSPPLFLLLIDISKSKKVIKEELVYWWHFINNQSQKAAAPPHVILAGSHKDMVKSRDREEVEVMIRSCIKRIPVPFEFVGYFPLNCRKLVSQGLNALLTQLNTTCQTLRGVVNVNLHCHILNALLRAPEFQDLVYCNLVDIMNKIESDDAPLPKAFSQLIPLLASLNDQGYILLLQNHTDESKSWVILKPDVLLTEVNGSVFAPKYLKEHFEFAMSTGVVTLSKLKEKFTEYNHEVIIEYLTHLEFCFRIKDQHTLDMITNNEVHDSAAAEEYYFFPSLVRVENPTNVCQPHQSIGYECGWLYKCSKETEQLTTRFLHVLILRLAFACKPPETESVVLLRKCSVWKHGIAWTNDGIEVIVEVGLQCRWVAVMMRCPATERVPCAELRSKVISTVLKTKKKFCPTITIKEYLIAPSSLKYPIEGKELTLYSMREVARATIEGKKYIEDEEGMNSITISQLLPFEPYHNIGSLVPKFFSGNTSVAITPEELTQLAEKCYDKLAELNTAFKPDISSFQEECVKADTEVERCVALFHILQRRGRFKTWRDFQQEFSRFSIFCKQSPLVRMIISMLNAHLNPDPVECRIIVN